MDPELFVLIYNSYSPEHQSQYSNLFIQTACQSLDLQKICDETEIIANLFANPRFSSNKIHSLMQKHPQLIEIVLSQCQDDKFDETMRQNVTSVLRQLSQPADKYEKIKLDLA